MNDDQIRGAYVESLFKDPSVQKYLDGKRVPQRLFNALVNYTTNAPTIDEMFERGRKLPSVLEKIVTPHIINVPVEKPEILKEEGDGKMIVESKIGGKIFVTVFTRTCVPKKDKASKKPYVEVYEYPRKMFVTIPVGEQSSQVKSIVDRIGIFPSYLLEEPRTNLVDRIITPLAEATSEDWVLKNGEIISKGIQPSIAIALEYFFRKKGLIRDGAIGEPRLVQEILPYDFVPFDLIKIGKDYKAEDISGDSKKKSDGKKPNGELKVVLPPKRNLDVCPDCLRPLDYSQNKCGSCSCGYYKCGG